MTQGTSPPEQKRGAVVGERAEPQCRTCLRPAGCLAAPSQDSGDGAVPGTHAVGDKLPPTLGTPPQALLGLPCFQASTAGCPTPRPHRTGCPNVAGAGTIGDPIRTLAIQGGIPESSPAQPQ